MSVHWQRMRLKFIAPTVRKILPSRPEGMRYIGLENIEAGTGKLLLNTEQEQVDSSVIAFDEHSVLFGKLRPYLAKVAMPDFDGVASTEIMVLEPTDGNERRFLAYSLLSDEFIKRVSSMTDGAKMPRANPDDVLNLRLCVPKAAEQHRIADYLDEQTAKIDNLMNMRRRQMALLKEQRAALIQRAVTRGLNPNALMKESGLPWLGNIPAHWEVKRNKTIFREIDNRSVDGSEELLSVSHLTGVTPRAQKEEVNMFLAESNEGYKRVDIGDLAINTMWAWMGALGFSNYSGIVSPSYNVYRIRTEAVSTYYDLLFRSPNFTKEIIRHSTGVWESRLRLYPQAFFEIRSPAPPLEEQREIVSYVEKTTGQTERVLKLIVRQLNLLAEYRAALIHECITGQRRIGADLSTESL
jgi:type I restriction enzyme S subunit